MIELDGTTNWGEILRVNFYEAKHLRKQREIEE
jgi:hypothetical protein